MDQVSIGNGRLSVSRTGLGCMGMSGLLGPADDGQSIATLQRALDLGINFFDTSTSYGSGHNQELLGQAFKDRRDQVVIHSKFGVRRDAAGKPVRTTADPETVRADCEASLKRFGFDHIDIWCPSRVDLDVPIEDTVGAIADLIGDGKVRFIGLSEASAATIERANKVHPIVTLQIEYSLFTREPEGGNVAACREFGMGLMAYSPLSRGLVTRTFARTADIPEGDNRRTLPRFHAQNYDQNLHLVGRLDELARAKRCTTAQLALAWLMSKGPDIIPIPGSKSIGHLEENAAACEIRLTADEVARIEAAVPPEAVAGPRYGEAGLAQLNR